MFALLRRTCPYIDRSGLRPALWSQESSALRASGAPSACESCTTLTPGAMVVLSACETGRSEEHASSLAEAFQVAGAGAVIASLWRVDDQATAELFRQFYVYLRNGHPCDEALALAQRTMQETDRWRHPYFWGAFVLTESAQTK